MTLNHRTATALALLIGLNGTALAQPACCRAAGCPVSRSRVMPHQLRSSRRSTCPRT